MTNSQRMADLYDAFARGNLPTVLGAMHPQVRWHEAESNPYMPSGEAWIGPDAVVNNLLVKLGADWDGFGVHPTTFHDTGNGVVVQGRYSGKYHATGKTLDAQFCHVWTLEDGMIMTFQQYTDTARLKDAMGA